MTSPSWCYEVPTKSWITPVWHVEDPITPPTSIGEASATTTTKSRRVALALKVDAATLMRYAKWQHDASIVRGAVIEALSDAFSDVGVQCGVGVCGVYSEDWIGLNEAMANAMVPAVDVDKMHYTIRNEWL